MNESVTVMFLFSAPDFFDGIVVGGEHAVESNLLTGFNQAKKFARSAAEWCETVTQRKYIYIHKPEMRLYHILNATLASNFPVFFFDCDPVSLPISVLLILFVTAGDMHGSRAVVLS